ncbi:hypothetical protein OG595_29320 [Streptomyces sp. NBC_01451]|nr:ATP-binding protein [Streptomyces sp. NBC_01451]
MTTPVVQLVVGTVVADRAFQRAGPRSPIGRAPGGMLLVAGVLASPAVSGSVGLRRSTPGSRPSCTGHLTERVRGAGTPVVVAVSLPPDPLPPGVDLTAYRVVQEALTNTIRHAPGAEASVLIGWTDDCLLIEVGNTRATAPNSPPPEGDSQGKDIGKDNGTGHGRGLIGLRERLAVYGGELTAGPTPAGGYRITARVPWRTP